MTNFKIVLLTAMLIWTGTAGASLRRVETNVHDYSLRVELLDGSHCTGTKIGRTRILLAEHCVTEKPTTVLLKKTPVAVTKIKIGALGGDYAVITVDVDLGPKYALIGPRPSQGDEIFIFGNPGSHTDQLRRGYISGVAHDGLIYAMLPIWKGDSGSAVFDIRGRVVAVVVGIAGNEYYPVAVLQPIDGK